MLKHGHKSNGQVTSTYNSWRGMIGRCLNPNHSRYRYYGQRGIKVCWEWLDFRNFLRDMGLKPPGMTLGRIDNSFGYCKPNCRWETKKQQANNRRSSRWVTINGQTRTMAQWLESGFTRKDLRGYIEAELEQG